MDVAFTNHDTREHAVLVESLVGGEPVDRTEFVAAPGCVYTVTVPGHTEEVFAISDGNADVVETVNAGALGTIPATTAVSGFSIINGIGGAASQLIASNKLANSGEVATSDVVLAGGVAILGALAGVFLLDRSRQ